jgi:hypothetical protein
MQNEKKMICMYICIFKCHACHSQPDFKKDKVGKHIPNCKAMYYIPLPNCELTYVITSYYWGTLMENRIS